MAIGERIRFFRNLRGMTQKYLGMRAGFPEPSADVRMAQYESGARTPKADLTEILANVLDISPQALSVSDIDCYIGLAHTLFMLEDLYGLKVKEVDGQVCLQIDAFRGARHADELNKILIALASAPWSGFCSCCALPPFRTLCPCKHSIRALQKSRSRSGREKARGEKGVRECVGKSTSFPCPRAGGKGEMAFSLRPPQEGGRSLASLSPLLPRRAFYA